MRSGVCRVTDSMQSLQRAIRCDKMQTNERGVVSVISRESLNEVYSGLEAKHNEIIRALTHRIFALESGWYNGHYQRAFDGKWVRDAFPIPVVMVKGLCDIEIQLDRISVSTKLKRDVALACSFEKFTGYEYEAYGVKDYLSDYYHQGQNVQELKDNIYASGEAEIGLSFSFPFEVTGQKIFEFAKLLRREGFYY